MRINRSKYKEAPSGDWVIFKHQGHAFIHPALAGRIAYLAKCKGKKVICTRGLVTSEEQTAIAKAYLAANPTWYMKNGAVYNEKGQCMVAAPGTSNHEFGHAADLDGWPEKISNDELAAYGLYKPMSYEPWHFQLIETKGVSKDVLQANWKEWCSKMDIEKAQSALASIGLYTGKIDGINGPKTQAAIKAFMKIACVALGIDYHSAEEVIKATQASPEYWLPMLKTEKYFEAFIMNIVNKMKGK